MRMHVFELLMIVCFGVSWPFNVAKSIRTRSAKGKSLIFLGEPDKHGIREQRYYWDNELPLPAFNSGDQITIKYTGKNIIGYEL